jgi:hypothetical protein
VDVEHTYSNPGVYIIRGRAESEDDCGNAVGTKAWVVAAGAPAMSLAPVMIPGGPPYRYYLQTHDEIRLDCLVSATVDWGDGSPSEPAGWYYDGGVYKTNVKSYPHTGGRTVMVANTYTSHCASNQAASISFYVGSYSLATHMATWGRVKAMYR